MPAGQTTHHERPTTMNKTIRIQARNNSDARAFGVLDATSARVKHNGGKTVIATVDEAELASVVELLDGSWAVASYEIA